MVRHALAIVLLVPLLVAAAERKNLLDNSSLENSIDAKVPAKFKAMTLWGANAEFALEKGEKHSGDQSFRISAKESTQSWLISEWIEVAPGETIAASAWMKINDFTPNTVEADEGIVLVANFVEGDGRSEQFADFKRIAKPNGDWEELTGEVKVPPLAAKVRLRAGFRNASGKCWIDDLTLTADTPLVARPDLTHQQITPEMGGVPVLIINRDERKSRVMVQAKLGDHKGEARFALSGEPTQQATVPVDVVERGTLPLEISLFNPNIVGTDNRKVTIPPPLVLSPAIPTHWAIEDGPATVEGDIDLAVSKDLRERSNLRVIVENGTKEFARWKQEHAVNGLNHFSIKLPDLPVGRYNLIAELDSGQPTIRGTGFKMIQQPFVIINRSDSQTKLNANGYVEFKGKPIFPLGIFNGPAKVKEMSEAGFTINHAYNAANAEPGDRSHDDEAKQFLDDTEANGMKALMLIPRGMVFSGDWNGFRRRVRMFKNHPALLAWDEEEGIARGDMDVKSLAKMRQIIREEDPNHPLMIGDSRDVITNIKDRSNFFPLEQMDLGMWWWYPIPAGAGKANMLEGDEKTKAAELIPPSFLTLRNTDKPLWVGVQAYKKPPAWARYPTAAEYRAQAFIAIIHGAKGLMWYGGSVEDGIFIDPKAGHWDDLKKLVRELHDLSPVFTGETLEAPKFTPVDAPISVALKRGGGRTVLIAVNRGTTPFDVTFDVNGKSIRDHFDAYETRFQDIKD